MGTLYGLNGIMPNSTKYSSKLQGKRVVIFGGSSGLGYAAAEAAIEAGAHVTICSSKEFRVEFALYRLAESYPSARSRLAGHTCDLSNPDNLEDNISTFFDEATSDKDVNTKVDHIIFTAGDELDLRSLDQITYNSVVRAGQIRFFAPLFVSKIGARYLNDGPQSSITLTAGALVQKPRKGWVVQAAYAAGMMGMVRSLAVDLAPVRVNVVSPGLTDTEMWNRGSGEWVAATRKAAPKEVLTGQLGTSEDVAVSDLPSPWPDSGHIMADTNLWRHILGVLFGLDAELQHDRH